MSHSTHGQAMAKPSNTSVEIHYNYDKQAMVRSCAHFDIKETTLVKSLPLYLVSGFHMCIPEKSASYNQSSTHMKYVSDGIDTFHRRLFSVPSISSHYFMCFWMKLHSEGLQSHVVCLSLST